MLGKVTPSRPIIGPAQRSFDEPLVAVGNNRIGKLQNSYRCSLNDIQKRKSLADHNFSVATQVFW